MCHRFIKGKEEDAKFLEGNFTVNSMLKSSLVIKDQVKVKVLLLILPNYRPPHPRVATALSSVSSFFSIFFFSSLFVFRWSQKSSINTPSIALYCWKMSPLRMLENTRSLLETTLESPMRQSASISTVSIISCSPDTTTNSKTINLNFHGFFLTNLKKFYRSCLFICYCFLLQINNLIWEKFRIRSFEIGCWIWWARYKPWFVQSSIVWVGTWNNSRWRNHEIPGKFSRYLSMCWETIFSTIVKLQLVYINYLSTVKLSLLVSVGLLSFYLGDKNQLNLRLKLNISNEIIVFYG